jgi:protein phosphatase
MVPRTDIKLGQLTHVGRERTENQDYYGYYEPLDDKEFAQKGRLIVVCDGMGGAAGGEVASQLAVKTILETYKKDAGADRAEAIRKAIESANKAIWQEAQSRPELYGMGSTSVALIVKDGKGIFAHTGDSRCYRIRKGKLEQITKDHSLVQQMVDEGIIEEAEAETHPRKNVILRSLGVKPEIEVEVQTHPLEVGDLYTLSSDGLTGMVNKEDVKNIVLEYKDDLKKCVQTLVDVSNEHGGTDNISVQVVKVEALKGGKLLPKGSPLAAKELPTPKEMERRKKEEKKPAAAGAPAVEEEKRGPTMAMAAPDKEALEKARKDAQEAGRRAREMRKAKAVAPWKPRQKTFIDKINAVVDLRIVGIVAFAIGAAVAFSIFLRMNRGY